MSFDLNPLKNGKNNSGSSIKNIMSFIFSGNPIITYQKLNDENYLNYQDVINMQFIEQNLLDNLPKKETHVSQRVTR